MPRSLLLVLTALATALPVHAHASAEQIFAAAAKWTVIVRTAVDLPFIEDEQEASIGSGFVVDAKRGWILTNAHVTSYSRAHLTVSFRGQKPQAAHTLYVDPYLDFAVIEFDPSADEEPVTEVSLDCEQLPPTGLPVGAFGHPWKYYFTGTRGITSAITARFGPDMLQTDAPINEGNSGGALISLDSGKVIGINAAIAVKDKKRAEGIGFAVPMIHACRILTLLRQATDPSPPESLVNFATGLNGERSLTVAHTRLPAGAIALRPDDTILAVNGATVATEGAFIDRTRGHLDQLRLQVERDGEPVELTGSWPAAPHVLDRHGLLVAGALFAAPPAAFSALVNVPTRAMVHHVNPGSEANAAGLSVYDLVLRVNGQPIDNLEDLGMDAQRARLANQPLKLVVMKLSASTTALFDFYEIELPVDAVEAIALTPPKSEAVAAR